MDVNELRIIITVVSFLVFLGIVYWAYSGRQKSRFDEASQLPFADEEMQQRTLDALRLEEHETGKSGISADKPSEVTHG